MKAAITVPPIKPIKIEIDFKKPLAKILTDKTIAMVIKAKIIDCAVGELMLSPIFPIATGIKVKPMVVITEPVTTGGKKPGNFGKRQALPKKKVRGATKAPTTKKSTSFARKTTKVS